MCIAVLGPAFTIPQVYKVWMLQDAGELSLLTWGSYLVFNIPMLLYGIAHREKALITMYILWIIVNTSVVCAIILYG